jgi:ribosomal protein S28E/S33
MLKQVMEIVDLLDGPSITGDRVKEFLSKRNSGEILVREVKGETAKTDFVKIVLKGRREKLQEAKHRL